MVVFTVVLAVKWRNRFFFLGNIVKIIIGIVFLVFYVLHFLFFLIFCFVLNIIIFWSVWGGYLCGNEKKKN